MSRVRKFGGTIYVRAIEAASPQAPAVGMGGVFSCRPPQKWAVGWLLLVVTFVLGCPPSAPPPAVGPLTCRAKPGKVDLLWTAAANATNYDVMRAQGGAAPSIVSTVQNPVYADFGLTDGVTYTYTVVARNSLGSAAPSPTCSATPNDRGVPPPDQPPSITSTPVIEAFENTVWYYDVTAVDPEGLAVTIAPVVVPFGMNFDPATSRLSWSPSVSQIGPHTVQVSASDPAGNSVVQPFSIEVKDFDDPPTITSAPERFVMVGQTYDYPATAFDPEGKPLAWTLAAAPAGMAIGAQSGALQWTPTAGDVGSTQVTVEVRDPAGNLDAQTYELDVLGVSVQLLSPSGVHTVPAGTALSLPVTANHPKALLSGGPLPSGSSLVDGTFTFTPTRDQEGRFDIQFEARLAGARDADLVTIQVTVPNGPPQITALPIQTVDEGQALSFVVTATDPDGDEVKISAPGLGLPNAIFNELTSQLDFTPGFDQQGSYNLTFVADDGHATGQGVVQVDVIDVAPPATNLTLVVDPPQSPTFAQNTPITGSVVGQAGPPPTPAPFVFITGVAPAEVRQGRSATVVLDGLNTQFVDGQVSALFGAGVTVDDLRVISPTRLEADVTVAEDASLGVRQILANDGGAQVQSVVAFTVTEGAAKLTGQILDPFTNQPVAGATVSVPGTNIFTTTAADGTFVLDGVPGGLSQIVVSAPNFEILSVDVALGSNALIDLDVPIGLKSLARPFNPGGSLPRAAVLASVLDRGANSLGGGLDIDQAEALISDTLIVVGGNEAGVLDDTGAQLNPNVVGAGRMSLSPVGLRSQAVALVEGQVITLGDLTNTMLDLFNWPSGRPLAEDFIAMFQRAVNEAWADPGDPSNAMAIVLFNPGNNLSSAPPLLTQETPLNRLQAFLMLSSYLLETTELIEDSIDQLLIGQGIDPTTIVSAPPIDASASRLASALGAGLGWVFGEAAYAQGVTVLPPNAFRNNGGTNGRTFRKIFKQTHQAAKLEAAFAIAIPIAAVTAAATATAIMTGGTILGVAGAVAAIGAVTAVMDGLLAILWQKYILGMFLAATLQELSPQPPIPGNSRIEGDKFILEFDQSTTHTINNRAAMGGSTGVTGLGLNPSLLQYSYALFRFPDMQTTAEAHAQPMGAVAQELGGGKYRFVLAAGQLRAGANYFRIATVQTVRKVDQRPLDGNLQIPLKPLSQSPVSQPGVVDAAKEVITKIPWSFNPAQVTAAITDNSQFFDSVFKPSLDNVNANVRNARVQTASEIFAIREARDAKIAARTANERALLQGIDGEITNAGKLKELAASGQFSPGDFFGQNGPGAAGIQNALGTTSPPSIATLNEVQAMTQSNQTLRVENIAIEDYRIAKGDFVGIAAEVKGKIVSDPTGSTTKTVMVMDPATKIATPQQVTYPHTPSGVAQAEAAAFAEGGKITQSQNLMDTARTNLDTAVDTRLTRKVGGPYNQWKLEAQTKITQVHDFETGLHNLYEDTATIKLRSEQGRANNVATGELKTRSAARTASGDGFEVRNAVGKGVSGGLNILGLASGVLDPATSFLQGVAVLESAFSPVHIYTVNPRQQFTKPPVLADPDLSRFGGVITTRVHPLNPKGGQIVSAYPEAKYTPDVNSTGFPPLFLASDSLGRVFSINSRSTTQFGGRLFRFDTPGSMLRSFAGSVRYFSTLIQYGRPAAPIAMTVGEYWEVLEGAPLEDLFVANVDFIDNKNEILRVPTHLLDRLPYSNGLGVDHVVGRPYAEHPDFQFTGPSDMAVMPAIGGFQRLFFTDEDTIWMFRQDLNSPEVAPVIQKLLVEPGRRWSGIDVDYRNNVYVADFVTGDLVVLSLGDVIQLEGLGGAPCVHVAPGLMQSPEYIALDQEQKRLVVSDDAGVHSSITLPVFVEGLSATKAFLVTLGKQFNIPIVNRTGCPTYRIVFPQGIHVEQRAFRMRLEGNATGSTTSKEVEVHLPAIGGSDVLDANQLVQDFLGYFN